jgi:nucleotide-binding universal stress UspA family protein
MFYLINSRYIFKSAFSLEGLFGNRYVLIAIMACAGLQFAYSHTRPLQLLFGSTDLSPEEWLKVALAGAFVFSVAEIEKAVIRIFRRIRRKLRAGTKTESRHLYKGEGHLRAPTSVLAATDFSDDATNASRRAAMLAMEHQGRLELLHVVSGTSLAVVREMLLSHDGAEEKLIDDAQRRLDAARLQIAGKGQVAAFSRVAIGSVPEEILSASEQADLLVLGARGLSPWRDLFLGTTADRLLRTCKRPVLVVKRPPEASYRRVLVPVDFSPHSIAALKMAMLIAPDADIMVVHGSAVAFEGVLRQAGVVEDEIDRYRTQSQHQALSGLNTVIDQVSDGSHRIFRAVEHEDAVRLILAKEESFKADLIVIGKHGKTIVEEMLLGSVTRRILSDSKSDVLIVHESSAVKDA